MRTKLLGVALLCAALGATSLPGPSAAAGSRRWSTERWKGTLSQPKYQRVVTTTHYLEASDGSQLSLTLHLPEGLPEKEKVSTLLQLTPYQPLDQALARFGGYAGYHFFVLRGGAYVEADARGTGGSDGCLDFGGSLDRDDARVFARWIREQPWSNGKIVTDGVSHPGMGSVVAHTSIPGLTGALTHAPVVSYYQDEWLQGAKFEDQFNGPLYEAIEMLPPLEARAEALTAQAATCRGQTTADYTPYEGPFTELWQDRDLSRFTPKKKVPILLTHGFVDVNVHPDHSQMYWDALPDDYPKYAIFGWWYHGYPTMQKHAAQNFADVRHRWMDTLLFGRENGLWAEPRVLVEDSTGVWHEGRDWPLEQSRRVTLHPTAAGDLASSARRKGEVSYEDRLGAQRGRWEGASVEFRSAPLKDERLVNGAPKLHLTGSSTATSTKWVAYLFDEAPNGTRQRITHGYADSHTWKDPARWDEIEPGKPYRWTVNLQPTAVRVAKGHRLVLVIASQDSRRTGSCMTDYRGGCYNPSGILPATTAGRATNTVHTGRGATRLVLDWADPATTRKAPTP